MKVLHNSCNTVTRALPDMLTLSPRASDVHIRQSTHAYVKLLNMAFSNYK